MSDPGPQPIRRRGPTRASLRIRPRIVTPRQRPRRKIRRTSEGAAASRGPGTTDGRVDEGSSDRTSAGSTDTAQDRNDNSYSVQRLVFQQLLPAARPALCSAVQPVASPEAFAQFVGGLRLHEDGIEPLRLGMELGRG